MKKNILHNFVFLGFAVLYDGLTLILSSAFFTSIIFNISSISVIFTFCFDKKSGYISYGIIYYFRNFYGSDYYCCKLQKFMQYAAVYNGSSVFDCYCNFIYFNTAANVCNIPVCYEGGDYL